MKQWFSGVPMEDHDPDDCEFCDPLGDVHEPGEEASDAAFLTDGSGASGQEEER